MSIATILIVDDHVANREYLVSLLAYRGYGVLEAGDGLEALTKVRSEQPDLVVADILMPTMDGYEFVKRVRADPAIAHTRVIFYTATYHEHEALDLARSCGVSDVLTKPSDPEVVLHTVEKVLQEVVELPPVPTREELDQRHLRLMTDKLTRLADDFGLTNQRYAALIEISLHLASERDPQRLLDSLCRIARRLIGSKYAILAVRGKYEGDSAYVSTHGMDSDTVAALTFHSCQQGLLETVMSEREPLRLVSSGKDVITIGLPPGHPLVHSVLAVPITSPAHTYGWICLSNRLGADEFNEEDEHLLSILAAQAGRIYENGSLYASLLEQEQRFRQLAENIKDVFWLVSLDTGEDIYISPAYEQIWGRTRQHPSENSASWISRIETVHPEDRAKIPKLSKGATDYDLEYRVCRPDGYIRWIHDRGFPVHDAEGRVYRFAGIAEDITKRKADEEKITRLTRIYAVLSQINSVIVRVHERQALFEEACRIVVEYGQFGMAWIGLLDAASMDVKPVAYDGFEPDLAHLGQVIRSARSDIIEGQGTVGQAIRSKEPAFCNDISAVSDVGASRREALQRGYHSVISLPLLTGGQVVGVVVLFAKEPGFFDASELRLLTELANDISFALGYIEKAEEANYLAFYDALTGLSNRTMFHERLGQFIQSADREREKLAVLMLDVDRFKTINDSLGRQAGDELIRQLAQRLKECVTDPSQLARIGADQFVMVLPDVRHAGEIGWLIEGRIKDSLDEPFQLNGEELRVSAKIGVALAPDDGRDADTLVLNAESAVRKAKASGEHYLFFDHRMSAKVAESLSMENKLRLALANDQFVLHYQPKVDLKTRRIVGMEALIRWQSPDLGLVLPMQFVPLLEETGMILDVGVWVIDRAASDMRAWQKLGVIVPRIAVNVSVFQLRQLDFVKRVEQAICKNGAHVLLDLELTESIIMSDIEDSLIKLTAARQAGLGVVVDDFGTGYSSLSYIARLPIDAIKIDRSFIVKMVDHPDDKTIVSTIITMAHNMTLKVVAEGVDSEDQVEMLRQMGCDEMQGFLLSKPLPFDDITPLLQQESV